MSLTESAIRKPVSVVIIFTLLVLLGIYSGKSLPIDMYPDTSYPMIVVSSSWGNSAPEEVEQNLTRVLETGLSGVTGLKHISSTSSTGYAMISLEFETGTDLDVASNDIRDKIDHVRSSLPAGATSPTTTRLNADLLPVMTLVIQGNRTPEELYEYADKTIAPSFEQIDGIASADIIGGREKCVRVSISRDNLDAYGLTITQISSMLSKQNQQSSAGIIESNDLNYTVTSNGTYSSLNDIKNTVIAYRPLPSGKQQAILLRDVADVYEDVKETTSLAYLDGVPSVMVKLNKQSGKNSVQAVHKVRASIPKIEASLPGDVKIIETANNTDQIESTLHEVISSVVQGAALAILVLLIFFKNLKSTLVIGFSIPVSIIITLVFMYFKGMTLNLLSLAGLLIAVGMLVDNSIVVLENIYTHASRGEDPLTASINGAREMVMPVTSSTLTSVCIFLPMIAFNSLLGYIGEAFIDLGFTISVALVCSLVTSIFLVPVLSAHYLKLRPAAVKQELEQEKLNRFAAALHKYSMDSIYACGVRWVLHHKALFMLSLVVLLVAAIASLPSRGFILMPESADNTITLNLTMPKGTTLEETESVIRSMESVAKEEIDGIKFSNVTVGSGTSLSNTNAAVLSLTLNAPDENAKDKLRKYFDNFPGAQFEFGTGFSLGGSGKYTLKMKSNDLNLLRSTAQQVKDLVETEAADLVAEVSSSITEGMPEVRIKLNRENIYDLGLSVDSIASELRGSVSGITAGTINADGSETDILVCLAEKDKAELSDLNNIFITNNQGERIPLSAVARYEDTTAPASIAREDQTRVAEVSIVPKSGVAQTEVAAAVKQLIAEKIPANDSLAFVESGDMADMMEMGKGFVTIIVMAMLLVFAVMACQFESFKDPFIIFFTIPLSFIGVAAIYALTGQSLSMLSILGVLMLVGVIVNNGIVLVDSANILRRGGMSVEEACVESARSRLRPILMSTLTTLISLFPMALFPSEGAELIQPINLTVLGGLGFGTFMTLFAMPAVYCMFNLEKRK